ncbi:hypothetical protein QFC20_007488 [Naganishia adeliensis]|uniref:Uncharacterized protein n=1 Tax=Naganishia adeliensis TaxID=92952 RepID=A0ACC2UYW3_9TREE|nr:hypothetical protein QFC20_007488 [Naganishia adeliensis]
MPDDSKKTSTQHVKEKRIAVDKAMEKAKKGDKKGRKARDGEAMVCTDWQLYITNRHTSPFRKLITTPWPSTSASLGAGIEILAVDAAAGSVALPISQQPTAPLQSTAQFGLSPAARQGNDEHPNEGKTSSGEGGALC